MYSNIPGVQIILSLLKKNNIKNIVVSPGTRNTPLVHSAENDDYFNCYSIVDERSAGFFALGLSESLNEAVCVTCTAATATCNYMPAIKEAYERGIQLIALTADQDTYSRFHIGDQNINQVNMYDGYIKYAVDLPKINNENDYWYFNRSLNEALLALKKEDKGPIQINFRMDYSLDELSTFSENSLKETRYIQHYSKNINWEKLANELYNKKIVVFCGSSYSSNFNLKKEILKFKKNTNAVILADYYSNIISEDVINPSVLGDVYRGINLNELKPDLIIFIGSIIYAPIKFNNKLFSENIKTWQIALDGRLNDTFKNVSKLFEIESIDFFENINKFIAKDEKSIDYSEKWNDIMNSIEYPYLGFTHFNAIKKLIKKIPDNSIVHMSVLDAIRISNYFRMPENVSCFANIGADGIDGALSTFLGQASKTNELAFLIVGDLSFMYDMNALYSKIPSNVRILVINNYAGSEFHKNFGIERIDTLNEYIAAGHSTVMKDVASINNIKYIYSSDDNELENSLNEFISDKKGPIILEVFTNAEIDAKKLKEFWKLNINKLSTPKEKLKNKMSPKLKSNIKKIIKKLK